MADLTGQLNIQRQINQLLQQRKSLLDDQNKSLSKQALLSKEISQAMQGKNLEGLQERIDNINRSFEKTSESAQKAAGGVDEMTDSIQNADGKLQKFNRDAAKLAGVVGFLRGIKKGFGIVTNVVGGAVRVLGSFITSIFRIGKSIAAIPFKIFGGLVEMSQQMGSPVFRQALEEVRKTFGDIASGSGLALKKSAFEIRKEFNSLTGATKLGGASFGRVFGYGREGLAAALKENAELATNLGGSFAQLRDELKGNYAELAIYRKGLGFTTEQQALLIKLTAKSGGDIMQRQKELSKMASGVGKAFGYSAKEVGTGLGEMFQDVKTFGGFTDKQLVQIRVQALRLGASMDALAGVSSGFDDYQKAQENVSFLNRAFGMTVDTMRLFREQDPVKRIQMLQKSFAATGRDVESMNRQELQYFAQSVNMSETDAKILFSKKNLQMDYNKVKQATNKTAKKELKTAVVLRDLSKQIERIFGSGGEKYTGFFDALGKGFTKGVRRTTEFRKVMRNLNRSLRITDLYGRQIGRNFVKHFPGVRQLLGALADFFDPRKLVPALSDVNKHFKVFFIQLDQGKSPAMAFDNLARAMMGTLRKHFGEKGEALELIKTAADKIITIFVNIKLEMYRRAASSAAEGLRGATEILREYNEDPNGTMAAMGKKGGDMFGSRFGTAASDLFNTLRFDLLPAVKQSLPVIMEAAKNLMSSFRDFVYSNKDMIVQAVIDTLKFVFKMKLEILSQVASGVTSDPMAAAALGTMLFGPGIVSGLAAYFSAKIGAAMTASMASGTLGRFFKVADPMIGPKMSLGRKMKDGMGNLARSMRGPLRFAMKRFLPAAVAFNMASAAKDGIQHVLDGGSGADAVEMAARSFGAGMISAVTLGLVDGESVITSMFGKHITDPIEKELHRLETRGSAAEKSLVTSAKNVAKSTKGYLAYAEAAKNAAAGARELGKYFGDADVSNFVDFEVMQDEFQEFQKSVSQQFSPAAIAKRTADREVLRKAFRRRRAGRRHRAAISSPGRRARHNDMNAFLLDDDFRNSIASKAAEGNAAAAYMMESMRTGVMEQVDAQGNSMMTPQMEKDIAALITNTNAELNAAAANAGQQAAKIDSGLAGFKKVFGKGGDAGRARVQSYQRFLKMQYDQMVAAGKPDEELAPLRKQMEITQENFDRALVREAKKTFDSGMVNAELKVLADKYRSDKGVSGPLSKELTAKLKAQAEARLVAAVKNGDLSAIGSDQVRAALETNMTEQGLAGVLESGQQAKLTELETVADTINRIKKLEDLPKQLESLQAKIGKIKPETVKAQAKELVTSAVSIVTAFTSAAKGKLDKQVEMQVHSSFITVMGSIKTVADAVGKIINERSVDPSTMTTRVTRFKNGVIKVHEAMQVLAKKTLSSSEVKNLNALAKHMPAITTGVVGGIPANLADKLSKAKKAIKTAEDLAGTLKKIGGGSVEGTVKLIEAINRGGIISVQADAQGAPPIEATINLVVDSSMLANAVATATFSHYGRLDQLTTLKYPEGSDNLPLQSIEADR